MRWRDAREAVSRLELEVGRKRKDHPPPLFRVTVHPAEIRTYILQASSRRDGHRGRESSIGVSSGPHLTCLLTPCSRLLPPTLQTSPLRSAILSIHRNRNATIPIHSDEIPRAPGRCVTTPDASVAVTFRRDSGKTRARRIRHSRWPCLPADRSPDDTMTHQERNPGYDANPSRDLRRTLLSDDRVSHPRTFL